MDRSGRVVILLTLIFCRTVLTKIVSSNEIAEATVKHLASIESGVPSVVFYKLYGGDALDETIRSPQLEHVSRLIISCGFDTGIIGHLPLEPTLIVMQGEVIWCINQIGKSLQAFKSSTKVLILLTSEQQTGYYIHLLWNAKFYRAVIVRIYDELYLDPELLFDRSALRSRHEKGITFLERDGYGCGVFAKVLLYKTALLMNTTLYRILHPCREVSDFCFENFMIVNNVDFDCTLYNQRERQTLFDELIPGTISSEVILVPRDPVNVMQLFFVPFSWMVWMVLLILICILEIIYITMPSTMRNEPFLFAVCGFEEYDLHVASRREKLILFPMVVLMFFITNAYSTILISLLIDRPANYPILTLENLVESGVRIKTNQRTYHYLRKHHILGDLLVVSNESVFNMDLEHAHVVVRETAERVLPMYYDSKNRMFRYNIMDQTLNMAIYMFRLSRRSDLLEVLQFVCHALIESGIRDVFKSKVDHFARQLPTDENDEELHFADLTLPWMALLCGLSVAGAALVVELVLSWALAHWRPIVKRLKFCSRSEISAFCRRHKRKRSQQRPIILTPVPR